MYSRYSPNKSLFQHQYTGSLLVAGFCLLMFACSSAICFDFDLSYDHDTSGIMSQSPFFTDNAHLRTTLIKFVHQSLILSSANKFHFFNRAPPA
jgi:hypothetical protein